MSKGKHFIRVLSLFFLFFYLSELGLVIFGDFFSLKNKTGEEERRKREIGISPVLKLMAGDN